MASCPLGFGGPSKGTKELTPYHCTLCRALLHEPVTVKSCGHVFCAFCIRRFRDCPTCGADIEGTNPSDLAETISKLLLGHMKLLGKAAPAASRGACPVAPDAAAASSSSASAASCPVGAPSAGGSQAGPGLDLPSLLLQLALESLAGGNPEAGLARLEMCANALCSIAEAAPASAEASEPTTPAPSSESSPATAGAAPAEGAAEGASPSAGGPATDAGTTTSTAACASTSAADAAADADTVLSRRLAAARANADIASRLGAVLGSQADCHRRLGDAAAAHRLYDASAACLAPWATGGNREAASALSVTHNKRGDLLLVAGRLAEARGAYEAALEIRRRVVADGGEAAAAAAAGAAGGDGACGGGGGEGQAKAAEAGAAADEEVVQDLCDLATSLLKVADVRVAMQEEERERGQQAAGQQREGGHPGAGADAGGAPEQEQQQQQGDEERAAHARVGELLAEARRALTRPELAPYARECGLGAEGAEGGEGSAGAGPEAGAAQAGGKGSAAAGKRGQAAPAAKLPQALVQRFGRVWGAMEQLAARVQGMQAAL